MTNNVLDNPILDAPSISPNSLYYRVKSGKVKSIATADDTLILAEPSSNSLSDSQYNKVTITASGHVVEYDDTPNAERICIAHTDGHFIEMSKNGKVTKVFGKDFEIVLDDKTLSIAGKLNITVQGDCNLLVAGNATTKIQGNETRNIQGNSTTYVKGTYSVISEKTLQLESKTNITTKSRGTTALYSTGQFSITSGSSLSLRSNSGISLNSNGNTTVNASSYNLFSSGNISTEAAGNITSLSGGSSSGAEFVSVSIPALTNSIIPTSQNVKFGLGFSKSLMEPSATEMFLNKSAASSALLLADASITYPKDRISL